jgi:hypothetical protein
MRQMADFILEIVGDDVSVCRADGSEIAPGTDGFDDWRDCTGSGDAEPALRYLLNAHSIEFRTIARGPDGQYVNRLAEPAEIAAACRAIYFDSETDFDDLDMAQLYLLWHAAHQLEA